MQKEIITRDTQAEYLLDHNLRRFGSYTLRYRSLSNLGATVSTSPATPIPSPFDETRINLEDDVYLPVSTSKIFKHPTKIPLGVTSMSRVDNNSYKFIFDTVGNIPITNDYIYYRSDYAGLFGNHATYGWCLTFDVTEIPETLRTGNKVALKVSHYAVEGTIGAYAHDAYFYFTINNNIYSDGSLICPVSPSDASTFTAARWNELIGDFDTAPITGDFLPFRIHPYRPLEIISAVDVDIVSCSTTNDVLGIWALTRGTDGFWYIYREGGAASFPSLGILSLDTQIDAVTYDLSLVALSGNGTLATSVTPHLVFLEDVDTDTRRLKPGTTRDFVYNGDSFVPPTAPATLYNYKEYPLPAYKSTGWAAKTADQIMHSPPPGMPYVKVDRAPYTILPSSVPEYLYEISLRDGKRPDYDASAGTDFPDTVRRSNPVTSATPKGIGIMYKGNRVPAGYGEVIGQLSETAKGPDGIENYKNTPADTFWNIREADTANNVRFMSINYQAANNITTLVFQVTNGLSADFLSDEFYDWSVKIKSTPAEMLPRPDPKSAVIRIPVPGTFGKVSIPIPFPWAPRLPDRDQREVKIPVGDRVTEWSPGMQFLYAKGRFFKFDALSVYAPIARVKIAPQYRVYEQWTSGNQTVPQEYPGNILQFLALQVRNLGKLLGSSKLKNAGGDVYNWIAKLLRRDSQPPVKIVTKTGATTFTVDLLGNWENAIKTVDGITPLPPTGKVMGSAFFIKTGYLQNDPKLSGLYDRGSYEHNHMMEELGDEQYVRINMQLRYSGTDTSNSPCVAKNHGHGFVGKGGYNRPEAFAVKFCVKE